MSDRTSGPRIVFVCWGNICRSPMAERIAERMAADAGLRAQFSSAATSTDEIGQPIDPRAVSVLQAGGYRTSGHRAHKITADEVRQADLVLVMEDLHASRLYYMVPDATNIRLITDFDPAAPPSFGIDDPWYGTASAFNNTRKEIERAMPGVLDWIRDWCQRSDEGT